MVSLEGLADGEGYKFVNIFVIKTAVKASLMLIKLMRRTPKCSLGGRTVSAPCGQKCPHEVDECAHCVPASWREYGSCCKCVLFTARTLQVNKNVSVTKLSVNEFRVNSLKCQRKETLLVMENIISTELHARSLCKRTAFEHCIRTRAL